MLHGLLLVIISLAVAYATITNGGFPGRSKAFAAPVAGVSLPSVAAETSTADSAYVVRAPVINRTVRVEQPLSDNEQDVVDVFTALSATPTQVAAEDAVVRAASVAEPPDLPPYQVYQVQDGDTVSSIAARFGIDAGYILANNAEISDSDFLELGQSILIPAGDGILHEVRYGETLSDISARYDVDVETIASFRANGIETADDISEAQLVYVPGGVLPAAPFDAAPPDAAADTPADDAGDSDDSGGSTGGGAPANVSTGPASNAGLVWPIVGPISSYYSAGHPLGIDIDGFNLVGASVGAATSGTVVFAGGNACCSYGLYVVIVSPEGIETLYAHLSSIYVSQGEVVSQGQAIGAIGDTGYSTGVHLHFEVIDNGVRQDPLDYLP